MPPKSRRAAEDEEVGEDITASDAPTSIDPYTTLNVDRTASASQITSAYRKAALKCHPDKVPDSEKEAAHAKFQEVAFAYAILSDERRRKRYDTTGRTEESLDLEDDDFDWLDFFRAQFKEVVTFEKMDGFKREYQGSEEERGHVLKAYERCKGDLGKVFEEVMCSDVLEDEERFREIIDAAIEGGEVEDFEAYSQESEKKRKARIASAKKKRGKEEKEASAAKEELEEAASSAKVLGKKKSGKKGKADESDLAALIQARQGARAGGMGRFMEGLEAKYGKKGKKRTSDDEPSEEAFAANRKAYTRDAAVGGAADGRRSKRTKT